MNTHAFTIEAGGILASIISSVSVRQSEKLCQMQGLKNEQADIQALWDTGATNSGISSALALRLGLLPIKYIEVESSNGIYRSNAYLVDIILPNTVSICNIPVAEFMTCGNTDVIIGMDIITCGDFAVSNYNRKTVVSFRIPSQKPPIDFRNR